MIDMNDAKKPVVFIRLCESRKLMIPLSYRHIIGWVTLAMHRQPCIVQSGLQILPS
jgi:hypothetical protein